MTEPCTTIRAIPSPCFPSRSADAVLGRAHGLRPFSSRIRLRDTGRQYLDNTGNADRTIDPWTTVDISLWFELGELGLKSLEGARAFLHLRNFGDTEYETWGYYYDENYYTPAAGRNFAIGVDYNF